MQQSSDDSRDFSYDITKDIKESGDFYLDITKNGKESDVNFIMDDSLEWCEEAQDLMITDDCKRKIILHRSRSKVYEYNPDKRPVIRNCADEVNAGIERTFFNKPDSSHQSKSNPESSDSKEEDSLNTVEENVSKKSVDVEVQTVACWNNVCNNLVQMKKIISPDSILLSEESLLSEDQSDCALAKEKPLFYRIETLTLIDDSASVSSLQTNNAASQKNGNGSATSTPQRKPKKYEKSAVVKVSRDDLKAVSWSRCLRNCTCISKRINESDSFTAYQTNAKDKLDLVSGVDVLPEVTAVGKSDEKHDSGSSGVDVNAVDISEGSSNYLDPNISIELKYTDEEDGIEFIEAKLPLSTR